MSRDDPHRGGTLSEMAPQGTSMPNDAGLQNVLPSVPRPDQRSENPQYDNHGLGMPTLAMAADNATDLPRSTQERGATGEVITGTGNDFQAEGEVKGAQIAANDPGARGNVRNIKHANLNRSVYDRLMREDGNAEEFIGEHQARNE